MQSLLYVKGSDGTANASQMTVTTLRNALATTILVNTVAGAPVGGFYASMGTPHNFTDPQTGETITIISDATAVDFAGHINAGQVIIDAIAPGYTDLGSKVGDIVVIRPVTEWANNIFNVLNQAHNDNGSFKVDSITDSTLFADPVDPVLRASEQQSNFVASGAILAGLGYGSTLTVSLSAGICYINGNRQIIAAVATRGYTASKDTYVDALYNASGTATIVYTEVANNAASPALAANSIRLGTVVSAANIAAATSIGQGAFTNSVPVVATQILRGFDTLGNTIYPKGSVSTSLIRAGARFLAYRQAAWTDGNGALANVTFDQKLYDGGNNYSTSTGMFTAPVAGLYLFTWSCAKSQTANTAMLATLKQVALVGGGATYYSGNQSFQGATTGGAAAGGSALVQMAAGDTAQIQSYGSGGAGTTGMGQFGGTYFSGALVAAS